MCVCVCACVCVCLSVCLSVCIYIHTYVYTYVWFLVYLGTVHGVVQFGALCFGLEVHRDSVGEGAHVRFQGREGDALQQHDLGS